MFNIAPDFQFGVYFFNFKEENKDRGNQTAFINVSALTKPEQRLV